MYSSGDDPHRFRPLQPHETNSGLGLINLIRTRERFQSEGKVQRGGLQGALA